MDENKTKNQTMGINYATYLLKDNILNLIKESGLPLVNVHFILSQILSDVAIAEQNAVTIEQKTYEDENK